VSRWSTYTACEAYLTLAFNSLAALRAIAALCFCTLLGCTSLIAQEISKKPTEQSTEKAKPPAEPENPAQIELLETHIRFESNGDSRKEVHTRVKINNEIGVQQFARINFGYNRAFESVEIPLVHITHASGGSVDILPSAITDQPNPVVVNAPAYQDVRIKSVRILGLEPGDLLEYRVVTTVSHHPLAPDFWLEHSFDRSGVVSREIFDLSLPAAPKVQLKINPATPATLAGGDVGGIVCATYCVYHWDRTTPAPTAVSDKESPVSDPDIALTTYASWKQLVASRLAVFFGTTMVTPPEIEAKAAALTEGLVKPEAKSEALYDFVSKKIRTVDLPLGSTGFMTRNPSEILASGYGTPEDKYVLFAALAHNFFGPARAGLISGSAVDPQTSLPQPYSFNHMLTMTGWPSINFWLELNVEIAPYQVIPSQFRGKKVLVVGPAVTEIWQKVDDSLPFAAKQSVTIDASLTPDGTLTSKVHYSLRGDNELLLRIAFHQTPKEKWRDVAQLLAFSDGFRGKIASVEASDPYATKEPFTVDYEISQPKFVDWSKKPVRIPALLPQIGLPDLPAKPASGTPPIELGTPLEVETHVVVRLPAGTTARAPIGVSVSRDYATFASRYSASAGTITATRHVNFLLRELPAERTADYNSFRHAVQNDEAQDFTLERAESVPAKRNSAAPDHPAAPKPKPAKP